MTAILSHIFGIYMIVAGIGLIVQRDWASKVIDDFEQSPALCYMSGAIILIAGVALILTHNIWSGWPDIGITLIGWGAAIEGAILLIHAPTLFKFSRLLMPKDKFMPIFGIGTILLGAALIWA